MDQDKINDHWAEVEEDQQAEAEHQQEVVDALLEAVHHRAKYVQFAQVEDHGDHYALTISVAIGKEAFGEDAGDVIEGEEIDPWYQPEDSEAAPRFVIALDAPTALSRDAGFGIWKDSETGFYLIPRSPGEIWRIEQMGDRVTKVEGEIVD